MYEYTSADNSLAQSKEIWSRIPLQAFANVLTPFSYSVLAEISRRAWFRYYERLGLTLPFTPRHLIRQYQGRAYLNIKWVCERDVEFANLEPLVFRINGEPVPLAARAKTNLIRNFRNSRNERRLATWLDSLMDEMDDITARARGWYEKVKTMRWSQAEILQIMEEIERYGVEPLMVFYAARHNLERAYNALLTADGKGSTIERLAMINKSLSDLKGLVEVSLTDELLALANLARQQPSLLAWLQGESFDDWDSRWADQEFGKRLHQLMTVYGHWTTGEGELANPRWFEQPRFLFKGVLACVENHVKQPAHLPSSAAVQGLINSVDGAEGKVIEQQLAQIRRLTVLQSKALHAFTYVLAGTRIWALAAGEEATSDQRLRTVDDSFFFELEELKRMMTGEWNVTNTEEIQATVVQRQAAYKAWQKARPGEVLFGNVEAFPVHRGLPGVVGQATGPLRRHKGLQPCLCTGAVVGAQQLDSGWTPTLPVAGGLLAAVGTPLDPIIAAARIWHVPTVVALDDYDEMIDGAQTRLDGTSGAVEQ